MGVSSTEHDARALVALETMLNAGLVVKSTLKDGKYRLHASTPNELGMFTTSENLGDGIREMYGVWRQHVEDAA